MRQDQPQPCLLLVAEAAAGLLLSAEPEVEAALGFDRERLQHIALAGGEANELDDVGQHPLRPLPAHLADAQALIGLPDLRRVERDRLAQQRRA